MASTYSPKLRFELIGAGEQAGLWGTTTNKNIGQLIEQAIAGVTTVELDGVSGNYTLTALDGAPDQSRSAVIKCAYTSVPATGPINLIVPTQTKLYVVRNDCGQTITVKTSAQVGGVVILDGESTLVFCDGTNAEAGIETAAVGTLTVSGGGTGSTSFTAGFVKSPGGTGALTSASAVALGSDVSGTLPVANGGTGATTFSSGRVLIGNGTGTVQTLAGSNNGDLLTWNSSLATWVAQAAAAAGVTNVTASSPLSSSGGTTPNISFSGTLAIANGGTGATSATNARTNLDVPSRAGSGATGTWGIDISGNAATATTANTATLATTATTANSITTSVALTATAGASAGAVGSYGFFRNNAFTATTPPGTTAPGSNLTWYSVGQTSDRVGSAPSGTWQLMGYGDLGSVFLRIS